MTWICHQRTGLVIDWDTGLLNIGDILSTWFSVGYISRKEEKAETYRIAKWDCKIFFRLLLSNSLNWKFTAMIILHFHLQPQFKYENFIYTSHNFTSRRRYKLNKLTLLPMCGIIAQLVEHRIGIAEVTGSNLVVALIFLFRLLLLNCLNWFYLRWSFFTFINNRSSNMNYFIYTSDH